MVAVEDTAVSGGKVVVVDTVVGVDRVGGLYRVMDKASVEVVRVAKVMWRYLQVEKTSG